MHPKLIANLVASSKLILAPNKLVKLAYIKQLLILLLLVLSKHCFTQMYTYQDYRKDQNRA